MEFTPAFWMIVGLTLVLGWVLGLMSRSGGAKWKRELKTERDRHAADLRERDARIAELERSRPAVAYRQDPDERADLRRHDPVHDDRDRPLRDGHATREPIRSTRP